MTKRVFISLYNNDKIVELAQILEDFGYEITSNGDTYNLLIGNKIKSKEENININNVNVYDIVIINFYPFEELLAKDLEEAEIIGKIDILRAGLLKEAAKNNKKILVVSSPEQYKEVIEDLKEHKGESSLKLRREFALKVFEKTLEYDTKILQELSNRYEEDINNYYSINIKRAKHLTQGENPQQSASLYYTKNTVDYELLNGKELSYTNITDAAVCTNILSEFYDVCACAIVKHNTPSAAALGSSIAEAWSKALDCDPLSAFGSTIGFTQVINEALAKQITAMYLETVIAPDYTPKALDILFKNKDLKVIKLNTSLEEYKNYLNEEIKITPFGTLVQQTDKGELNKDNFKVATKTKPTPEMVEDMIFAWKIAKHSKSNAVVIAKDFKTIGIGQGQTNRLDAFEIALNKACDGSKEAIAASDGEISSIENIYAAAQGRISAVIQPGGNLKDDEIIKTADKYNIAMITTGIKHYRH